MLIEFFSFFHLLRSQQNTKQWKYFSDFLFYIHNVKMRTSENLQFLNLILQWKQSTEKRMENWTKRMKKLFMKFMGSESIWTMFSLLHQLPTMLLAVSLDILLLNKKLSLESSSSLALLSISLQSHTAYSRRKPHNSLSPALHHHIFRSF